MANDGLVGCFMPQSGMSDDTATYPYTLTISPSERLTGHFEWAIRRHGRLVERSDRVPGANSSGGDFSYGNFEPGM